MDLLKIGIIKENKVPPDHRVPLTPKQCKALEAQYPQLKFTIQTSDVRVFKDEEYASLGLKISNDLSHCDILMGIKEVPVSFLLPDKTYMFFSHTIKLQAHNRKLLKKLLELKIKMIDYEVLTDKRGKRLAGFGRYAGIVGCYNGFIAAGKKLNLYDLKQAITLENRIEMEAELEKVKLPQNFKIVLTGDGRVAGGAVEIIQKLNIRHVSPKEFLYEEFEEPVYTQLRSSDLYIPKGGELWSKDGKPWDFADFHNHPENYYSVFTKFSRVADFYLACHYWNPKAEFILTEEDLLADDFKIKIIADISCDVAGPIHSTIRASSIPEPLYGYDRFKHKETDFHDDDAICVMAVDNLPCELPADASEDFGNELIHYVFPSLLGPDKEQIIERATITKNGKLTERYQYMKVMLD